MSRNDEHNNFPTVGDSGAHHKPRPLASPSAWKFKICGEIAGGEHRLSIEELLSLERPPFSQPTPIECVSAGLIAGRRPLPFSGVRFSTLAQFVEPTDPSTGRTELMPVVKFKSLAPGSCGPKKERHWTALPLGDCLEPANQVMLATHLDGRPLPYEHGGPLRVVVGSELYFYKAVKWLHEIELVRLPLGECRGTWEEYAGYHNRARVRLKERFEPRMRWILDAFKDSAGEIDDESELVPEAGWRETFLRLYGEKNFSRLIVARLHEMGFDMPRDFRGATFAEGNFRAKMRGTRFASCEFLGANLSGGNFSLSYFTNARFSGDGADAADLSGCDFEGAYFQNAWLQGVRMDGSILTNATFTKDFRDTDRVRGLSVENAINLDPETAAWLRRNGAKVDNVLRTT